MNQKNFKDHLEEAQNNPNKSGFSHIGDSGIKPKQVDGQWVLSCMIKGVEYRYMMPYASKRALTVAQYSMMKMYDSPAKIINSPFWEKV